MIKSYLILIILWILWCSLHSGLFSARATLDFPLDTDPDTNHFRGCSREIHLSMVLENILLTLYIFIGAWLEERKLVMTLGNTYGIYQKKVSMFFPVKWIMTGIKKR